ncbi:hypothetical protein [Psychroserpens sp.]|jgi:transposase|uniref:hypothetical protein n=1 Tax=Psychroserpens sp. TaxID=2020870 RepID=UPI0039E4F16D
MNKLTSAIWFLMLPLLKAITISLKTKFQALRSFKKKLLNCNGHCVMEATGCYYYQLAYYLFEDGKKVSV